MRIFKGLENIHAVIDRHNNEWRRENGEPEIPEYTPNEAARKRWEKTMNGGTGGRNPKRFLEGTKKEVREDTAGEGPEVEIVEAIKQEGVQHSWLYNEVEKAVRAAVADDRKHTKVIAIFVPVIQNAKEFEEIPVDESVTLPPVEEEIPVEDDTMPFEIVVEEGSVPEEFTEITAEAEEIPEEITEKIVEEVSEQNSDALNELDAPEMPEEAPQEKQPAENSAGFDLIPESQEHPDEELVEAFNTMEEKLAESPEPAVEELTSVEEEITEQAPGDNQGGLMEDSFRNTAEENAMADDFGGLPVLDGSEEVQEAPVEEIENGEAMSFDEFPVIKEESSENSNENDEADVEDFIEEVKPEAKDEAGKKINTKKTPELNPFEPPAIDDFEDDEVFEEPLEMLDETPSDFTDFDDGEINDEIDNKDIKIE